MDSIGSLTILTVAVVLVVGAGVAVVATVAAAVVVVVIVTAIAVTVVVYLGWVAASILAKVDFDLLVGWVSPDTIHGLDR